MIAVDTNVLIYAHREETAQHGRALACLSQLAEGLAPWGIPLFCMSEFVRVVTHRRVSSPPSPLSVALAFLDALLQSPSARLLLAEGDYFSAYRSTSEDGDARGNLAFFGISRALCITHGARLLTGDRDFARFSALEVVAF